MAAKAVIKEKAERATKGRDGKGKVQTALGGSKKFMEIGSGLRPNRLRISETDGTNRQSCLS